MPSDVNVIHVRRVESLRGMVRKIRTSAFNRDPKDVQLVLSENGGRQERAKKKIRSSFIMDWWG
jgi:hypothetical protein